MIFRYRPHTSLDIINRSPGPVLLFEHEQVWLKNVQLKIMNMC